MKATLILAGLLLIPSPSYAKGKVRICYFTLNDEREFQATKKFMDKLNRASPVPIEVKEFLSPGGKPDEAFKAMVESGVQCDGLVISGHHTGSWGGHRANGKLALDEMEKLSCNPKYADWFRNIGAVWLQGCRTLGVGEIEPDDQMADVDFHTNRVGQVAEEDGLEQNFAELNMEFTSTLDQDNPLASRYMRLFPQATNFGWTKSAPGDKSKSYLSLLYHMAQTARALDGEFPDQAPDAANLSAKNAAEYANAVLFTLNQLGTQDRACQDIRVDSWLAHGNVSRPGKYYFDNPDLRAYPSLASSGDATLMEAREIDCMIKSAIQNQDTAKLMQAIDLISSNPDYLRFSLNTLIDLRSQLVHAKASIAPKVLDKMRGIAGIESLLQSKLQSKQVGVLRKIDYYAFYRDLTGKPDKNLERVVNENVVSVLSDPLPALDPRAEHPERSRNLAANYRATLFQSLVKNKMAGPDLYQNLLEKDPESDVLKSMAIQAPRFNREDATLWLLQISASPKADSGVGNAVLKTMKGLGLPQSEYNAYYRQVSPLLNKRDVPMKKFTLPNGGTVTLPESGGLY